MGSLPHADTNERSELRSHAVEINQGGPNQRPKAIKQFWVDRFVLAPNGRGGQLQTLSRPAQKAAISSIEPTVTRDTVGQIGQERPISTLWVRKAACTVLAGVVFQSTMNMLALVG